MVFTIVSSKPKKKIMDNKEKDESKFRSLIEQHIPESIETRFVVPNDMKEKTGISKRRLQVIYQNAPGTEITAKEAVALMAYFNEKMNEEGKEGGNLTIQDLIDGL